MRIAEKADLKSYSAVYIGKVDVSDVKVDIFDAYQADEHANDYPTRAEKKNKLMHDMRRRFAQAISEVIPVVKSEKEAAAGKTAVVDLKLSGTVQDEGLLDSFIRGGRHQMTQVSFSCRISDYNSHRELVTIADSHEETVPEKDISTLRGSDINNWYKAIDIWAGKVAALFGEDGAH